MAVPKFVWQGCLVASLACQTYLEHILDLEVGCAHTNKSAKAPREQQEPRDHSVQAEFRNKLVRSKCKGIVAEGAIFDSQTTKESRVSGELRGIVL